MKKFLRILYYLIPSFIRKPLNAYKNSRYMNKIAIGPDDFHKQISFEADGNNIVRERLLRNEPLMVARIGGTEMKCMYHYLNKRKNKDTPIPYSQGMKEEAAFLSGIYPQEDWLIDAFCKIYIDSIKNTDIMAVWYNAGENTVCKEYCPDADLIHLDSLESFFYDNPWTEVLENKKVLIISMFDKVIKEQYQKRKVLFKNPKTLPPFELITYQAIDAIGGNEKFESWIVTYNFMCSEIEKIDFDIAIVSAGGYGLPLAAHIKKTGKQAIHLAGATQLLFWIKGQRWDLRTKYSEGLYNEHWIYLPQETRPLKAEKLVEYEGNLPYWKS